MKSTIMQILTQRRGKQSSVNILPLCLLAFFFCVTTGSAVAEDMGTAFTYQGRLTDSGSPASGTYDFEFKLYDAATNGTQVDGTIAKDDVDVSDGLFTVQLNFGTGVFAGEVRYLEIGVRPGTSTGAYTVLSPRQTLTATPYAIYALGAPWDGLTGVPSGFADGQDNDTIYTAGTGLTLNGNQFSVSFAGSGSASTAARSDHTHGGGYWQLTGNAGTNPATNFLGTTDAQSLELRVNNSRALRLDPHAVSPNIIGGFSGNGAASTAVGATIGGGGESGLTNRVTDNYGTVGGGRNNQAGDNAGATSDANFATIAGGRHNTASAWYATVGGGWSNNAIQDGAAVGGGQNNTAGGRMSIVGGGDRNAASGVHSTVGGGLGNDADAFAATIAGGGESLPGDENKRNRVTDDYGTIGGGGNNQAGNSGEDRTDAKYATVGGGEANTASDRWATVGGGISNTAGGEDATVGGGWNNDATGTDSTIAGGAGNGATGFASTVGGGLNNTAEADYATIAGGGRYDVGDPATRNRVTDNYGTIGGGGNNQAGDNTGTPASANFATVGGGHSNTAGAFSATVAGGAVNSASASWATVGGGNWNTVTDENGTIAGGNNNQAGDNAGTTDDAKYATIGGGIYNVASGESATVAGGEDNVASGDHSTIGGGEFNQARWNHTTVGGGMQNIASTVTGATIGGGYFNKANGPWATIGGGWSNTAGVMDVSGYYATVGGGTSNSATGLAATIPGGEKNSAEGSYSFAAGRRAKVHQNHTGAILFADSNDIDFRSSLSNEFAVRCTMGARFVSAIDGSGFPTAGVILYGGGNGWSGISDRNAKENFAPVDGQEVLASLAKIPIETWNLKSQDPSIRHIGPMAQDFYAAFEMGENERHISTVDADGVALAAIQGLYQMVQEKDAKITAQQKQIQTLEGRLAKLEQAVACNLPE